MYKKLKKNLKYAFLFKIKFSLNFISAIIYKRPKIIGKRKTNCVSVSVRPLKNYVYLVTF